MTKLNPIKPSEVITPGMFVGRMEETETVEQSLRQTRDGNPHHFIFEGERGIGKSSLCKCFDSLAKGDIPIENDKRLSFIVSSISLHEAMSYDDIVDEFLNELRREMSRRAPLLESCKKAWDFLSSIQVTGIKYDRPQPRVTNNRRLEELTDVLVDIIEESAGAIEGVLLL